jgi:hypothetical protein
MSRRSKYESKLCDSFIDLALTISNETDYNVVIRPHPSETTDIYKKYTDNSNVHVSKSGIVRPWIMASSSVIHNSCTTGIESALLNRNTISYRPMKDKKFDIEIPNIVSREVRSASEAIRKLNRTEYSMSYKKEKELKKYISNTDFKSSDLIANKIDGTTTNLRKIGHSFGYPPLRRRIYRELIRLLHLNEPDTLANKYTHYDLDHKLEKFPPLNKREVSSQLDLLPTQPNLENVDIRPVKRTANTYFLSLSNITKQVNNGITVSLAL